MAAKFINDHISVTIPIRKIVLVARLFGVKESNFLPIILSDTRGFHTEI